MSGRRESLDLIRAVAIILVVLLHSIPYYIPIESVAYNACHALGTLGVPLFVILTGYLMVDRDYSKSYLSKYTRCNLIPLIVCFEAWNVIWYVLGKIPWLIPAEAGLPMKLSTTLKAALFIGNTGSALWYLPMCIGLYLGLPIASRLFRWAWDQRNNLYLTILIMGLAYFGVIVPTLSGYASSLKLFNPVTPVISLNIFGATVWGDSVWMIYLAAGFALKRGWLHNISIKCLVGCLACVTAIMFAVKMLAGGYANILVCVDGILLFASIDRLQPWLEDCSHNMQLIWRNLSHYSFPIYMIHLWVLGGLGSLLMLNGLSQNYIQSLLPLTGLCICLLIILVTIILSCLIAKTLGFIPVARRWLFLWKK